jgi:PhnB protein
MNSGAAQSSVTPYLTVRGALEAIAFYERAFGAQLLTQKLTDDGKRVVHAAVEAFGTMIMLSDEFPEYDADSKSPLTLGGTTVTLHVGFDNPAEVDVAIGKASATGCAVTTPAMDAFWGMRYGRLKDPFGHVWAFGAPLAAKPKGE